MTYKIIIDSCGELTDAMKQNEHFCNVALELSVDDHHITDDETFDQADFLRRVKESKNCPKSSCPSPESYMEAFGDAERIYMITLSSNLSGSYNSAELAKNIYSEEHPDADIHVFDSRSASVGETLIGLKVQELEEKGQPADFATVLADIRQRDYQDTHRAIAPLKQADDAILVDTSDIGFDESFELLKRTILAHI